MELGDQSYYLSKDQKLPFYKDYAALKDTGYKRIAAYSGSVWTNYNDSDPGITILQILCYALTELGNKADIPIQNLLTQPDGTIPIANHFYTPQEAYACNPVTPLDFCKFVLSELPQIKQVYLSDAANTSGGATMVFVECKPDLFNMISATDKQLDDLRKRVALILRQHSNIGQLFCGPVILQSKALYIHGCIDVQSDVAVERIIAMMLYKLNAWLSPFPTYAPYVSEAGSSNSLSDLMQGAVLSGGYIVDDCIVSKKQSITADEVGAILLSTDLLQNAQVTGLTLNENDSALNEITFCFDESPVFTLESLSLLIIVQNTKRITSWNSDKVLYYYQQLIPQQVKTDWGAIMPKGEFRKVSDYYSIQYDFPSVYHLTGKVKTNKEHLAKIKQLKGYLALFEQLMADYLAQVANVSSFFSFNSGRTNTRLTSPAYSYQTLYNVPGINDILNGVTAYTATPEKSSWQAYIDDSDNPYLKVLETWVSTDATNLDRRLRTMEHLLARSGKQYDHQPLQLTNPRYGKDTIAEIAYLQDTLRQFPVMSANRARSYYKLQVTEFMRSGAQACLENELCLYSFYQGIKEAIVQGLETEGVITVAVQQNDALRYVYPQAIINKYDPVEGCNDNVLVWWNDELLFCFEIPAAFPASMTKDHVKLFLRPYLYQLSKLQKINGLVLVDGIRLVEGLRMHWRLFDAEKNPLYISEILSPELITKQLYLINSQQPLEIQQSRTTQEYEIGVRTNRGWNFVCSEIKTKEEANTILSVLKDIHNTEKGLLETFITNLQGGMVLKSERIMNSVMVFLPSWIYLFQKPAYQSLLRRKVMENIPAFTKSELWLLSLHEMKELTTAYFHWMKSLSKMFNGEIMNTKGKTAVEKIAVFIDHLPKENNK